VRVNCEPRCACASFFFPHGRAAGADGAGAASTASFQPVTYLTTYAATKAFDRFFRAGLAAEVARFGVNVTGCAQANGE